MSKLNRGDRPSLPHTRHAQPIRTSYPDASPGRSIPLALFRPLTPEEEFDERVANMDGPSYDASPLFDLSLTDLGIVLTEDC